MSEPGGRATALSHDGVRIPYHSLGEGPALVLIPGALHGGQRYLALAERLAKRLRVCLIDRRGRPGSPPQLPGHGIDTECEDVIAVMRETDASRLFGHSSGGVVALQTALRAPVERLAVYEPPVSVAGSVPSGFVEKVEGSIARGRRAEALAILAKGVQSDPRLQWVPALALKAMMRLAARGTDPALAAIIATVDAFPAEYRMVVDLDSQADRYREMQARTLVMCGERTARYLTAASFYLAGAIRGSSLMTFAGLDHDAPERGGVKPIGEAVEAFMVDS